MAYAKIEASTPEDNTLQNRYPPTMEIIVGNGPRQASVYCASPPVVFGIRALSSDRDAMVVMLNRQAITMAKIKPFKGVRPPKEFIEEVASRPYDVLNSQEARAEAEGNEKSLYHIIKPEIDFPEGTDEHDPAVYLKAAANFNNFQEKGWLVQDQKECYYVYAQTMNGKTQYGLVVGAYVPDYMNGTIKKHELTRRDKEEDRMKHVRVNNANIEPVFFAYPDNSELDAIVMKYTAREPEYNFVAKLDGFGHTFWIIDEDKDIARITELFGEMPALYIADGHHRSAAAALVGAEKAKQNPDHKGDEEYNYFMAVCFPANQLTIIDYNRVVKDLNGLTEEQFVERLTKNFVVEEKGSAIYKPGALHNFSLYLGGKWYSLTAKPGTYDDNDPIGVLDVTISSNLILDEILGIKDLRSDKRIDFVGGIRGLGELKRRVDSGEMKVALALPLPWSASLNFSISIISIYFRSIVPWLPPGIPAIRPSST